MGLALGSLELERASRVVIPAADPSRGEALVCDVHALSDVIRHDSSARFDVELLGCRTPETMRMESSQGSVRVYAAGEMLNIVEGDIVRLKMRIKAPRDFRNEGAFSYSRFLHARGIGAVGSLAGPEWVLVLPGDGDSKAVRMRNSLRSRLDDAITSSVDGQSAGVLRALVGGRREAVPQGVRSSFSRAGIAHLLAISGLHVGYVALFIYLLVRLIVSRWTWFIRRIPLQKIAAAITLPSVWGFVILVGAPVSAVRAGIMISVYLAGVVLGLRQQLAVTLAIAAIIILVAEPLSLFDVSFQLSFVSVLAIILIAPKLLAVIQPWFVDRCGMMWRALYRLCQLVAVTIAATIGSLPLVAYHFHMITAAGLVTNLAAVPWMGVVIMPLATLSMIVTFVWPGLATMFLWPAAGVTVDALLRAASFSSRIAEPLIAHSAPNGVELGMVYALICVLVFWRSVPYRRIIIAALMAGLVLDAAWWQVRPMMTDTLEVIFIDVGQGDAALVRFPKGKTMVIDGGGLPRGAFDVGEHVVVPALLRKGIHRLDWLMLSHPHHDHYRGLAALAEQFKPKILWTNGRSPPEQEQSLWDDFVSRVEAAGTAIETIDAKHGPITVGGVTIDILYPNGPLPDDTDLNDTSVVVKLTYKDVSFLFTGDLMEWGERQIIDNGGNPRATVLKVGHHGSDTSSTSAFLEAVQPHVAVMSLGQYNSYGMPDDDVLDRLDRIGAKIYRTDIHGAITVRTDGADLEVDTVVK